MTEDGGSKPSGEEVRSGESAGAGDGREAAHGSAAGDGPEAGEGPEAVEGPEAGPGEPGALLSDVSRLRRQARSARHAYWFPLVIFGVLICASVPFYIQPPPRSGVFRSGGPFLPALGGFPYPGWRGGLAYYWLAAIIAGLVLTGLWYRWHGRKVGLVTPSRGYLITGAILALLALAPWLPLPGDLVIRGTFPFVIIGLGLWMLVWAERSWALLAIVVVYTGTALLASLYDIENVVFRLGWIPVGSQWRLAALPNVLLPALVLLVAGGGAFLVQRQRRTRSAA